VSKSGAPGRSACESSMNGSIPTARSTMSKSL
jgi:hypothetical protein